MRIGVAFPQTEIGEIDAIALRDYVQTVEGLGFSHLVALDHVLGVDPTDRKVPLKHPYTHQSTLHDAFVLFSYLGGLTTTLEFATRVLVLPLRQTAIVAKQAAEVDILTQGRFRLGVGLGWNVVEYEALNQEFETRGRRIEEQIAVLRALWTQELVDFTGRWHRIDRAAIKPLPVQRPIPVWMGGMSEPALRRMARIADGWFPDVLDPAADASRLLFETVGEYIRDAGRDPADVGIEGNLYLSDCPPEKWSTSLEQWSSLGAQRMGVFSIGCGLATVEQHIGILERFRQEAGSFDAY